MNSICASMVISGKRFAAQPPTIELLIESELIAEKRLEDLIQETNELISISVSSIKTARKKP